MALFSASKDEISEFGDAFQYIELLESIGAGASLDTDVPVRNVSAYSFMKIAFIGFEQARLGKYIRQGESGNIRDKITRSIINISAEEMWVAGTGFVINDLHESGEISDEIFFRHLAMVQTHHNQVWRNSARISGEFLRKLQAMRERKGHRGRPLQARSGDALANLVDSAILRDAAMGREKPTPEDIESGIPEIVRAYLRTGQLQCLGQTRQEAVDRHSKRLRSKFKELIEKPRPGENSIYRKS